MDITGGLWDEAMRTLELSSSLRLSAAAPGGQRSSTTTRSVPTTATTVLTEAAAALVVGSVIGASSSHTATTIEVAPVSTCSGTTFFDKDLFASNVVRVRVDSSIVGSCVSKLDKCTVLRI